MLLELPRRKISKSWRAAANYMNWHRGALSFLPFSVKVFLVGKDISLVPLRYLEACGDRAQGDTEVPKFHWLDFCYICVCI